MSIAGAVREIEMVAGLAATRRKAFRAQQLTLDGLIGEVEEAVMNGLVSADPSLFHRARTAIAQAHGRDPLWLTPDVAPVSLLNHLLIAEGQARQRFYRGIRQLDLRESA